MSKDDTITVSIPGSKSHSNRALILAALSSGTTTIKNAAICDDTNYLIKNLQKLGIKIQQQGEIIKITGIYKNGKLNFPHQKGKIKLFTGNAGTTTRFLTALATLTGNEVVIDGDSRMHERPIEKLTKALNQLGAKIETTKGCPPVHIHPQFLAGGTIDLPGDISSQYLSALLMITPFAKGKTVINITKILCSKPYIALTLKVMKDFDLKVQNKNFQKFVIEPKQKPKAPKVYIIETDASSASYFGAYAALHPEKKILLKNIHKNSLQGDIKFLEYLKKMGCKIQENKLGVLVEGPKNLKALGTIDMNETPDLVMTFAILALFTKGKTRISNIANLRIKETDRLAALETEIKKLTKTLGLEKSIIVKTGKDWIEIQVLDGFYRLKSPAESEAQNKKTMHQYDNLSTNIHTYNDHRIAMAFGILTDLIPNLKIENPSCVAKSYPNFWQDLKKLTDRNSTKTNIILTGLRGSGKSKIGKMLAQKLKMKFVDIDEEIVNEENTSIPDIVAIRGWKYFRTVENKVTQKVAKLKDTVISTGGGTIIDHGNEKALKQNGRIIYLNVKPEIAAKRILKSKKRPPLTNKGSVEEEIRDLYKTRHDRYSESANIIFNRSENLEKDCAQIIERLNVEKERN